eukprot:TRINITY_DN3791_c0_g1_i1.p1 TRINITY_DN3791_c0_g1~~TRINITY_DN3791_c0_g1_i1.p1  ORF type:complete len:848 (-),score=140.28 TRINITY_DN3791_c0_g1_i1:1180-3519(-)
MENRTNIDRMALSPNGKLLISVDNEGRALFIDYTRRVVLHRFNFKRKVFDLCFSHDGLYFAVTFGKHVRVYHTPTPKRELGALVLVRTYTGLHDDVTCLSWSHDDRFFIAGSKDMTCRIFSREPIPGWLPFSLSGHRDVVVGCFFSKDSKQAYTIGRDGSVCVWDCQTDETGGHGRWTLSQKHYFKAGPKTKVITVMFHEKSQLLVAGLSNGVFGLYEMPSFASIHTLSIGEHKITSTAINASGEWLAFGSAKLGQLLVWEWHSESYVLKQQGHFYDMNVVAYSPDGRTLATGGDDGKVKFWSTTSGHCFCTFADHVAPVTGVVFVPNGTAVLTSSMDGTVRAFDTVRYRNFRTFTTPSPVQFTCVCVDSSGEVVCAGSHDPFNIYVWSVQSGRLLDVLSGHQGPISSLVFSPTQPLLASTSWDKTVKLWDVFEGHGNTDTFTLNGDALSVQFRPDGKEICASSLDGLLSFFDVVEGKLSTTIEGRRDIAGGRHQDDRRSAKNSSAGKSFTTICYSADGLYVLAGGNSKYICIYGIQAAVLIKKYQISHNLSLDGILDFLNSKNMTDAGPIDAMDVDSDDDLLDTLDKDATMPGARGGDLSSRKTRPAIRTKCLRFSPTGRAFAAATTEGLLLYSLDEHASFDPYQLELEITPEVIRAAVGAKDFAKALMLALRLNEKEIVEEVFEAVPGVDVQFVVQAIATPYAARLMTYIATYIEQSRRIEFYLRWCVALLTHRGRFFKENSALYSSSFRMVQKAVLHHQESLSQLYVLCCILTLLL